MVNPLNRRGCAGRWGLVAAGVNGIKLAAGDTVVALRGSFQHLSCFLSARMAKPGVLPNEQLPVQAAMDREPSLPGPQAGGEWPGMNLRSPGSRILFYQFTDEPVSV